MRANGIVRSFAGGAAILLSVATAGCALLPVLSRNTATAFRTPDPVPRKIAHPERKDARLAVLWVGHATCLVQLDDRFILTDPVFTSTVGQVSRRLVEPGIEPSALPKIDAVLISHMHPDHLSLGSLEMLEPKIRHLALPRGGLTYLTDFSFDAFELGTWEAWERDGLRITAVPVKHVGFRYGIDDAWMPDAFTGYVVEYHGLRVYFGGDTAYDERAFIETAHRFPSADVALLPISPAEPREFMRRTHVGPEEAVQVFLDLGAKTVVPIHRDTFVNSSDDSGVALARFLAEAKAKKLPEGSVQVLGFGEQKVFVPLEPK
jgi:N-acyl-phosphatidylethanolamine-hydrolysing phospholipase D